jgi:hypothetical protein
MEERVLVVKCVDSRAPPVLWREEGVRLVLELICVRDFVEEGVVGMAYVLLVVVDGSAVLVAILPGRRC